MLRFRNPQRQDAFDTEMYRPTLKPRERMASLLLVGAIHVGLVLAMLNLSGAIDIVSREDLTQLVNVASEPPPPPVEEVEVEMKPAPKEEGEASPPNIESKATPIPDPQPRIQLPVPPPMPVSRTPNEGSETTQGSAPVPGPGTGAGGTGNGTGAGGSGSGAGGGGGGQATGVRLVRSLTSRDYPDAISRRWPRGGRIFVRLRIEPDGSVSQCDVMRGFGNRDADEWTCSLLRTRAQFRPATDDRGRPIAAWFGYIQQDTGRFY